MPYQPTNPYPYNTAIDLQDGLQFRFKVDNYDTIESFKIELYDYLKNKKLYTIIRTVGDIQIDTDNTEIKKIIEGDKQLIQILNENEEQILLEEYTEDSELPIKGGLGVKSIGEVDITPYLMTIEAIEMKKYYGNTQNYEQLNITDSELFVLDEKGTIIEYKGKNSLAEVVIPYKTSEGYVRNIGANVFANDEKITRVVVPSCVTIIGDNAFYNCENLQIVNLNYGVSKLNSACFMGCENLSDINLLDSIDFIGDSAFEDCMNLIDLRLPWSLTQINEGSFRHIGITMLELPPNLECIGKQGFFNCQALKCIQCNDKLRIIDKQAFGCCNALITIDLNEKLVELGSEVFFQCKNLQEIIIPQDVQKIGEGILRECVSLFKLTIPFIGSEKTEVNSIEELDSNKTENNHWTSVLGYFFGRTENTGVRQKWDLSNEQWYSIPSSLGTVIITNTTFIPYGAFSNCTEIREVVMVSTIMFIDDYGLYNCVKISDITLSPNTQYIGNYAFALEKQKVLE